MANKLITLGDLKQLISGVIQIKDAYSEYPDSYCPTHQELVGGNLVDNFSEETDGISVSSYSIGDGKESYSQNQNVVVEDVDLIYVTLESISAKSVPSSATECGSDVSITVNATIKKTTRIEDGSETFSSSTLSKVPFSATSDSAFATIDSTAITTSHTATFASMGTSQTPRTATFTTVYTRKGIQKTASISVTQSVGENHMVDKRITINPSVYNAPVEGGTRSNIEVTVWQDEVTSCGEIIRTDVNGGLVNYTLTESLNWVTTAASAVTVNPNPQGGNARSGSVTATYDSPTAGDLTAQMSITQPSNVGPTPTNEYTYKVHTNIGASASANCYVSIEDAVTTHVTTSSDIVNGVLDYTFSSMTEPTVGTQEVIMQNQYIDSNPTYQVDGLIDFGSDASGILPTMDGSGGTVLHFSQQRFSDLDEFYREEDPGYATYDSTNDVINATIYTYAKKNTVDWGSTSNPSHIESYDSSTRIATAYIESANTQYDIKDILSYKVYLMENESAGTEVQGDYVIPPYGDITTGLTRQFKFKIVGYFTDTSDDKVREWNQEHSGLTAMSHTLIVTQESAILTLYEYQITSNAMGATAIVANVGSQVISEDSGTTIYSPVEPSIETTLTLTDPDVDSGATHHYEIQNWALPTSGYGAMVYTNYSSSWVADYKLPKSGNTTIVFNPTDYDVRVWGSMETVSAKSDGSLATINFNHQDLYEFYYIWLQNFPMQFTYSSAEQVATAEANSGTDRSFSSLEMGCKVMHNGVDVTSGFTTDANPGYNRTFEFTVTPYILDTSAPKAEEFNEDPIYFEGDTPNLTFKIVQGGDFVAQEMWCDPEYISCDQPTDITIWFYGRDAEYGQWAAYDENNNIVASSDTTPNVEYYNPTKRRTEYSSTTKFSPSAIGTYKIKCVQNNSLSCTTSYKYALTETNLPNIIGSVTFGDVTKTSPVLSVTAPEPSVLIINTNQTGTTTHNVDITSSCDGASTPILVHVKNPKVNGTAVTGSSFSDNNYIQYNGEYVCLFNTSHAISYKILDNNMKIQFTLEMKLERTSSSTFTIDVTLQK